MCKECFYVCSLFLYKALFIIIPNIILFLWFCLQENIKIQPREVLFSYANYITLSLRVERLLSSNLNLSKGNCMKDFLTNEFLEIHFIPLPS